MPKIRQVNEFRSKTNLMNRQGVVAGPPMVQSGPPRRQSPIGHVTLERMVKYLMEGNPVPTDLMLDLELNERVGWKLSWCETKVSQELRRYGFVLEHKGDLYSARKYR